jgi:hypothetical protein
MVRNENSSASFLVKDAPHRSDQKYGACRQVRRVNHGRTPALIMELCRQPQSPGIDWSINNSLAQSQCRWVKRWRWRLRRWPAQTARRASATTHSKTDMVAAVETTKRTAAELRHPASRYGPGPSGCARANTSGPRMTARRPAGEDIAIRG